MQIGIDGNMWYCSNGLCLADPNAKFSFARTLREAVNTYNKDFNEMAVIPESLVSHADQTPEQYKLQERSKF